MIKLQDLSGTVLHGHGNVGVRNGPRDSATIVHGHRVVAVRRARSGLIYCRPDDEGKSATRSTRRKTSPARVIIGTVNGLSRSSPTDRHSLECRYV